MRTLDLIQAFSCNYVLRSNPPIQVLETLRRFIYYKRREENKRRTGPVRPCPSLVYFSTHSYTQSHPDDGCGLFSLSSLNFRVFKLVIECMIIRTIQTHQCLSMSMKCLSL